MLVCESLCSSFPLVNPCILHTGSMAPVLWRPWEQLSVKPLSTESWSVTVQWFGATFILILSLLSPFYRWKKPTKDINNIIWGCFGFHCRMFKNSLCNWGIARTTWALGAFMLAWTLVFQWQLIELLCIVNLIYQNLTISWSNAIIGNKISTSKITLIWNLI